MWLDEKSKAKIAFDSSLPTRFCIARGHAYYITLQGDLIRSCVNHQSLRFSLFSSLSPMNSENIVILKKPIRVGIEIYPFWDPLSPVKWLQNVKCKPIANTAEAQKVVWKFLKSTLFWPKVSSFYQKLSCLFVMTHTVGPIRPSEGIILQNQGLRCKLLHYNEHFDINL